MFSVLMTVYGGDDANYFDEALRSVLEKQTLQAEEVVLVVDGPVSSSIDDVILAWSKVAGGRLFVLRLSLNGGLARALNYGLKYCSNEFVARMDSDDIADQLRFEKQVQFLKENPYVDVLGTQISEFSSSPCDGWTPRMLPEYNNLIRAEMKRRNPMRHPTVFFRKSKLERAGGFPSIYPEDYMMWVKMLEIGAVFHNLPDILVYMRVGDGMLARRGVKMLKGELRIYLYLYRKGITSLSEFFSYSAARIIMRLSPKVIKSILYRSIR